jgi:hypothetical protein
MTAPPNLVADCVTAYAARLHAAIGERHRVASPLGAWLLLALAAPASTGRDRETLTEVLGCDTGTAARAAADLLANPHPVVASAAAFWTSRGGAELSHASARWRAGLPPQVTTGDLPGQAGLDSWAREHTFGLIDRFPVQDDDLYLVLASALATKVSWTVPFDLAPGAILGGASPWSTRLRKVLRTPRQGGHTQYIAVTPDAGDVIVHAASAVGGLLVVSVAAAPGVPAGTVLAVTHRIAVQQATGQVVQRRELTDLPLGEGPLWLLREVSALTDTCIAVLPAWSARSNHDLSDASLGFTAAKNAIAPLPYPWQARQSAMARYSRTGFEAAAVTAIAIAAAAMVPARRREAELRFAHPYAVVAITTDPEGAGPDARGHASRWPWRGLPVFSAWVSEPEDAELCGRCPERCHRGHQPVALELSEDVLRGVWLRTAVGNVLNAGEYDAVIDSDLVEDEVVRRFGLNVELSQVFSWKGPDVSCDDHLRAGLDGSCEYMPVVRIGQLQAGDQRFIAPDQAIRYRVIDQVLELIQFGRVKTGVSAKLGPGRLIDDLGCPLGLDHPRLSDPDEQVSLRVRIERVSVVDDYEWHVSQSSPSSSPSAVNSAAAA